MTEEHNLSELLAAYFRENGDLRLPGLGRFEEDRPPGAHPDAASAAPRRRFYENAWESPDPRLVDYITAHSRKMRSLAVSDLESLSAEAIEMLNVGQPFTFEGIGTLQKDAQGEISFLDEVPVARTTDPLAALDAGREKPLLPPGLFGGAGFVLIALGIVFALGYFLFVHTPAPSQALTTPAKQPAPAGDKRPPAAGVETGTGPVRYEVVFETSPRPRALRRYRQLRGWGHEVLLRTSDSVMFTLAIPFQTPPGDTAKMKDSIRILYGRPVYIRFDDR